MKPAPENESLLYALGTVGLVLVAIPFVVIGRLCINFIEWLMEEFK